MKAYCLASSSAGNCFILDFDIEGKSHKIMVECGLPLKTIYQRMNEQNLKFEDVEACLITHHHSDHSRSVRELIARDVPVFASKGTLETLNVKANVIYPDKVFCVLKGLFAKGFPVEHDAIDSMGFVIKTDNECVIFINDNKRWTCNLTPFKPDYVFIECNYDQRVVYPQITALQNRKDEINFDDEENQELNVKLKQLTRNVNSHMSLRGCVRGLQKLNLSKCKTIFLMHLSDRYANEYRFKQVIQTEFGIHTYVCEKQGGIK